MRCGARARHQNGDIILTGGGGGGKSASLLFPILRALYPAAAQLYLTYYIHSTQSVFSRSRATLVIVWSSLGFMGARVSIQTLAFFCSIAHADKSVLSSNIHICDIVFICEINNNNIQPVK